MDTKNMKEVLFTDGSYSGELRDAALIKGACIVHETYKGKTKVIKLKDLKEKQICFCFGSYKKLETYYPEPCHQSIPCQWVNPMKALMPLHKHMGQFPWPVDEDKLGMEVVVLEK